MAADEYILLKDMARQAKDLPLERFLERFPHPFLLVERHEKKDASAFGTVAPESGVTSEGSESCEADDYAEERVYSIAKSGRNTFKHMVAVGRSRNCDIILAHPSISKLHAYFKLDEDTGTCFITDAGSKNRTFIEDFPLVENKAIEIQSGQAVRFGDHIRGTFFLHDAFLAFLKEYARRMDQD